MKKITLSVLVVLSAKEGLEERMHLLQPLGDGKLSFITATVYDKQVDESLKNELLAGLNLRGFRTCVENIKLFYTITGKSEARMYFTVMCDRWHSEEAIFQSGNKFLKMSVVKSQYDSQKFLFANEHDSLAITEFFKIWVPMEKVT